MAAEEHVVAEAAVDRESDGAEGKARGMDRVVAGPAVDHQLIAGFGIEDGIGAEVPLMPVTPALEKTVIISLPAVPLTVTRSTWPSLPPSRSQTLGHRSR